MELMLLSLPTNCFIMKACKVNGFKHSGGKVFSSYPIDLDFAMLHAFPTAYQVANPVAMVLE